MIPCANVVVRSHSERVAAGGIQPRQLTVSLAPKVTFSENTVLLSLQREMDEDRKVSTRERDRRIKPTKKKKLSRVKEYKQGEEKQGPTWTRNAQLK